jgi:hypothetical protein
MNPTCPKCGARMTGPTYHRDWIECRMSAHDRPQGEHLHYHCACGFDTTRHTRDTKPQTQETP